jgi:hypothetical protein
MEGRDEQGQNVMVTLAQMFNVVILIPMIAFEDILSNELDPE